jgi:hypothetical protein
MVDKTRGDVEVGFAAVPVSEIEFDDEGEVLECKLNHPRLPRFRIKSDNWGSVSVLLRHRLQETSDE